MKHFISLFSVFILSVYVMFYVVTTAFSKNQTAINYKKQAQIDALEFKKVQCQDTITNLFLGIDIDELYVESKIVPRNTSLKKLLANLNFDSKAIKTLSKQLQQLEGFEGIKSRQNYFVFSSSKDSIEQTDYMAFQISKKDYVVINCKDEFKVDFYSKSVDTVYKELAVVVDSKFSRILKSKNISLDLIEKINNAFANRFSVAQLRNGDTLRVIYSNLYLDGDFYEIGAVQAAAINTKKKDYFATSFFIDDKEGYQYVDENGKYQKKLFLNSPLKNGRLASRFSMNRFHPVLMEVRPHLGTDFAAPHGTPILATADGVVEIAARTINNGNFVKIKHDKVYETQYLHMCRFEKGIKKGVRVRQGQIIGYVGSTGLATGPHVCYRFWKNGKQVDPLKEKNTITKSVSNQKQIEFANIVQVQKEILYNIAI